MPNAEKIVTAIYAALEKGQDESPRAHLGASIIGRPCARQTWYSFRWAKEIHHEGKLLRIFRRGHLEEEQFVADLRAAGITVADKTKANEQFSFKTIGGHFGASLDAVAKVEEENWCVLEFKTMNAKAFNAVWNDGVQVSKPEHFAQMQCYIHLARDIDPELDAALYLTVCKDDDRIYAEWIEYSEVIAKGLIESAENIIYAAEPPERAWEDPTFYQCKWCDFSSICHDDKLPQVSCRTCAHVTPEEDGNGRWFCELKGEDRSYEEQREACPSHLYIPPLISYGVAGDSSSKENWVEYTMPDGRAFKNGSRANGVIESTSLRNLAPALVCDQVIEKIRTELDATIEPFNDEIPF